MLRRTCQRLCARNLPAILLFPVKFSGACSRWKHPQLVVSPLRKLVPRQVNSVPHSQITSQCDIFQRSGCEYEVTVTRPNRSPVRSINLPKRILNFRDCVRAELRRRLPERIVSSVAPAALGSEENRKIRTAWGSLFPWPPKISFQVL
jgi:hypothetical protein